MVYQKQETSSCRSSMIYVMKFVPFNLLFICVRDWIKLATVREIDETERREKLHNGESEC